MQLPWDCLIRAAENYQLLHQRLLHSPSATVWCTIAEFGVRGPYFFEEVKLTDTLRRKCTNAAIQPSNHFWKQSARQWLLFHRKGHEEI
ncbi:UNVERIFIED_CONTAM: hypothetical protein NCL1_38475 [Trichonephila clavipes]